jgi:hypothetical protein
MWTAGLFYFKQIHWAKETLKIHKIKIQQKVIFRVKLKKKYLAYF